VVIRRSIHGHVRRRSDRSPSEWAPDEILDRIAELDEAMFAIGSDQFRAALTLVREYRQWRSEWLEIYRLLEIMNWRA
jgi:hypothetical protein